VRRILTCLTLIAAVSALAGPAVAAAGATISASLIPDGTYTVTVEKVIDPKHVLVQMSNGVETTLTAGRANVDFSRVKANQHMKLSIAKGDVLVFIILK